MSRRARVLIAVVLLASMVFPVGAGAEILPPNSPAHWRSSGTGRDREDWQNGSIVLGGGLGIPSFPGEWHAAPGWSFGLIHPTRPWLDVSVDFDSFSHRFDSSGLRANGATEIVGGNATFSSTAVGVRFHAPMTGWRWYGVAQATLPDVSRPALSYRDAGGVVHTNPGIEIFGFDPGFVFGFGYERCVPGQIGGHVEERLVIAPGSTEPTQILSVMRVGLTIPLPF